MTSHSHHCKWEKLVSNLEKAIELIHAGNVEEARPLLEQVIKEDRHNLSAWQQYADTWPNPKDKIRVWEVCLRHNPASERAQQALALLKPDQPQEQPVALKSEVKPLVSSLSDGRAQSPTWLLWVSIALLFVVAALAVVIVRNSAPKDPQEYRHTQPMEYYLYVPKAYSADEEWPLFVGIHGSGGTGLDCWNLWQGYAEKEGYILLCPTIPGDASGFRQDVGETTVWSAIGEVKKEYRIKQRMFFSGFSAGAFFIQGFTYHYPQYVSGLSILSAAVYLDPSMFAELVPMVIVIGDQDHPDAVQTSQMFAQGLQQYGFDAEYTRMPGVGHAVTKEGVQQTIELFRKITTK